MMGFNPGTAPLRIGILGGTFDPPHLAHIHLAETAHQQLELDQIFFVLAAEPPHKHGETRASVSQRLAMLQKALVDYPQFEISHVDVDRPGPHYSVDTLRIFKKIFAHAELYFIMGSDSLADLANWKNPTEILKQCKLAVMKRPGYSDTSIIHNQRLPELTDRCVLLEGPELDISSSQLLRGIEQGNDVAPMLASGVWALIQREQIYAQRETD
ncbi:MAG: nicotinate-nucleotide adenylyltransferase [Anaerolineaceae bacterium]|nr:nicotinate-nucleotide adenylyltransferase [Anaerolineaceae bacterium]